MNKQCIADIGKHFTNTINVAELKKHISTHQKVYSDILYQTKSKSQTQKRYSIYTNPCSAMQTRLLTRSCDCSCAIKNKQST